MEIGPRVSFMLNIHSAVEIYHQLSLRSSERKTEVPLRPDGFIWKQTCVQTASSSLSDPGGTMTSHKRSCFSERNPGQISRTTLDSVTEKDRGQNDHSLRPVTLRTQPVPRHLGLTHCHSQDPMPDAKIAGTLTLSLMAVL